MKRDDEKLTHGQIPRPRDSGGRTVVGLGVHELVRERQHLGARNGDTPSSGMPATLAKEDMLKQGDVTLILGEIRAVGVKADTAIEDVRQLADKVRSYRAGNEALMKLRAEDRKLVEEQRDRLEQRIGNVEADRLREMVKIEKRLRAIDARLTPVEQRSGSQSEIVEGLARAKLADERVDNERRSAWTRGLKLALKWLFTGGGLLALGAAGGAVLRSCGG